MADISTLYAKKLRLKSPFVVASSGLTSSFKQIESFARAGAGAVVLKSIFEEELDNKVSQASTPTDFSEAMEYLDYYIKGHELQKHLDLLSKCTRELGLPIIASINCYKSDTWIDYATKLVEMGASAIELNVMRLDTDKAQEWGTSESELVYLVDGFRKRLPQVPLTLKLGKYYSNLIRLSRDLHIAGADGLVLFNRTYMLDVDIEVEKIISGSVLSHEEEIADSLRYVAMVRGAVPDVGLALSTGAKGGADLVKGLLVGADAVQYCSALYRGGAGVIEESLSFLQDWMARKQYETLDEVKGRLAATRVDRANIYQRTQFMKYFASEDSNPTDAFQFTSNHPELPF